jgi:site-specific recombinase XerD
LEHYLKTVRNCNHNTTIKYIKNLKKIVNLAIKNDWLSKNPFIRFEGKIKAVKREYLTAEELQKIIELRIKIPRLDQIRDVFVFSCYTGLAYIDVANLTQDNIVRGIDGEWWIFTQRIKTENKSNVPLLPMALSIIQKYKIDPESLNKEMLLPVISNQKLNAYLKEIATLAGINKNLTFHLARHTFATTVTLANGVPIESVSEMLGHKSIRTTQIYAKVIEKKVSEDMKILKDKLENNKINSKPNEKISQVL